jgi:hypothetical protein
MSLERRLHSDDSRACSSPVTHQNLTRPLVSTLHTHVHSDEVFTNHIATNSVVNSVCVSPLSSHQRADGLAHTTRRVAGVMFFYAA